jgi:hypothetical protein
VSLPGRARCMYVVLQVKWGDKEYGPIFNDTFLRAVFNLQDQIQRVIQRVPNNEYDVCHLSVRPSLWSSGHSSWLQNGDVLCFQ